MVFLGIIPTGLRGEGRHAEKQYMVSGSPNVHNLVPGNTVVFNSGIKKWDTIVLYIMVNMLLFTKVSYNFIQ
jgi:hypothetical protein